MGTNEKNNIIISKRCNSGITLVALVISIIVILILAGVSINAAIGKNGIITNASKARLENEKADAEFDVSSALASVQFYEYMYGDFGRTMGKVYSVAMLQQYASGRINAVMINSTTKEKIVYYTNDNGSYTVIADSYGNTKAYSGIYITERAPDVLMLVNKGDTFTLSGEADNITWYIDKEDKEDNIDENGKPYITLDKEGNVKVLNTSGIGLIITGRSGRGEDAEYFYVTLTNDEEDMTDDNGNNINEYEDEDEYEDDYDFDNDEENNDDEGYHDDDYFYDDDDDIIDNDDDFDNFLYDDD